MDLLRIADLSLNIEHGHADGTWASFEPRPSHHDPADHDPEREWANGRIYACTACDELIRVGELTDPGLPGKPERG